MGITSFSIELLDKVLANYEVKSVCELGAQNLYNQPVLPAPYADKFYTDRGISYTCIDTSGENNALQHDLSKVLPKDIGEFDLVTDFGTSEHIPNFHGCFKNVHNLCKVGGVMIHENPKTGNWPGHGFHYVTQEFYTELASLCGYSIIEMGEHPAMWNNTDGWNVYCILLKTEDIKFPSKPEFSKLPFFEK